jgi:6-pyruvoyl-tetrahydropterin synthase
VRERARPQPPLPGAGEGESLDEIGLLVDFVELKKVVHSVLDRMDDQWLNDWPPSAI